MGLVLVEEDPLRLLTLRSDASSASERYGWRLVEPPGPTVTKASRRNISLESRAISDRLNSGAFAGIRLAYATGLGLLARWVVR